MLSYHIPENLKEEVRPGSAVVAPLSGYSRLGIVVDVVDGSDNSREYIREVLPEFSISQSLAEVCSELSELFAIPVSTISRTALPPGLNIGRYQMIDPEQDWPWKRDSMLSRARLKSLLGGEGLKTAEDEGRIKFTIRKPEPRYVEWAEVRAGAEPELSRAPRQRNVYDMLVSHEDGLQTSELLAATGASRGILRELVGRGAVKLEKRPEAPPILETHGRRDSNVADYDRDAGRVADRGGTWAWRIPSSRHPEAVAAFVEAAIEGGEQVLVLAPEIDSVEHLTGYLSENLSQGYRVAAYHSGLDSSRGTIYEKARDGGIDVVVGTRAAALMPMRRLGAVCVVDEPNTSHRAEPGYEGLQIHVRDIAIERGRAEDCGVLLLSPFPTLRVFASVSDTKELPARPDERWPNARIVDMSGSGAMLSPDLLSVCRRSLARGKRVALVADRLGYATSVSCARCGTVKACPRCELPLTLSETDENLTCGRCGYQEAYSAQCEGCGSRRTGPMGFGIDRLREELSNALGVTVGKLSSGILEYEDSQIVVATVRSVIGGSWDVVIVPDADTMLSGGYMGASEHAFRTLYGISEAAEDLVLVQTQQPEHHILQAALRGDYPTFAEAELARLENLGYPPYGHLASLVMQGNEVTVRRAVESKLRPSLEPRVSMSNLIPPVRGGEDGVWRILLRSSDQKAVARAGARAARMAAKTSGANTIKTRVEIDPEEV